MKHSLIALVLAAASLSSQAQVDGIVADGISSGIASTVPGLTEANPLGLLVFPIKLGIVSYAKTLPPEEGIPLIRGINSTSWGGAANNLCIALTLNPACLLLGITVGGTLWMKSSDEREFYSACAAHKRLVPSDSSLKCVYTPKSA